ERLSLADEISDLALEINEVAGSRRHARSRLPQPGRRRVDRPRRRRGVDRGPVNRSVQGGGAAFAVLLEAHVDRSERSADVGHVVDDKPALQRVAAAPVARPTQAALYRIVEGIALEVAVVPSL